MSLQHTTSLSKLGLGCVTFGREIDKQTSFKLMDYAYDNGINSFDTAAAYAGGISETIVGEWLKARSLRKGALLVATKILPPYGANEINLAVESCLKRLQVNTIDILYLHRWDETLEKEEPWCALDKLVSAGKIQAYGVSNFDCEKLSYAVKALRNIDAKGLSYVQNNNNFAVSDVDDDIKTLCKANNINIVTFSPLGAGFLTGKHRSGVQTGSRFSDMPAHQAIYFNENSNQRLEKLMKLADYTGYSTTKLALSWAIHQSGIASVLVGGRSIDHLAQAISASELVWTKEFETLVTM